MVDHGVGYVEESGRVDALINERLSTLQLQLTDVQAEALHFTKNLIKQVQPYTNQS